MTATRYDITIEQGVDYIQPFPPILNNQGAPINIMNATAAMQIRSAFDDPCALVTLTTENGGLTPTQGGVWVPNLGRDRIAPFIGGAYLYDLKMLLNNVVSRPYQGTATLSGEVTTVILFAPASSGDVLLEDGGVMLQEDGSKILTEGASNGSVLLENGGNMLREDGSKILTEE